MWGLVLAGRLRVSFEDARHTSEEVGARIVGHGRGRASAAHQHEDEAWQGGPHGKLDESDRKETRAQDPPDNR